MRLARFQRRSGGAPEAGVVIADTIYPAPPGFKVDMTSLIARWSELKAEVARWPDQSSPVELKSVRLLAPNPRPSKMMAIGFNYVDHAKEVEVDLPKNQIWFPKLLNSLNGPFDPILIPDSSTSVDYEVEMVAVIGQRGRNIRPADASNYIFGYCVGNDVSMRDWQFRTHQWMLGKSGDTHAPCGPWITTADEIPDPHKLAIKAFVNGQQRQSANTGDMIFNVFEQIAELSQVMTLEPGDMIFSGTPSGVGLAMKPPKYLAPGDVVRCEIESLGHIEGRMTSQAAYDIQATRAHSEQNDGDLKLAGGH